MLTYVILLVSIAAMLAKPFGLSEAFWIAMGAISLWALGRISSGNFILGVEKGKDVYFFLVGMMLLAELARKEQLFDWMAAYACRHARGSPKRLFFLIYGVGVLVTCFLSNDATAVVLTPAVAAVVRTAKVHNSLPYLLICAFVANAASFVLPISNPANLVVYGSKLPPLQTWVDLFFLPSILAITVTGCLLYFILRSRLSEASIALVPLPKLPKGGILAAIGIVATAITLLVVSTLKIPIGLPTFIAAIITTGVVMISGRNKPGWILNGISWSVVPLVAGLFVMVEALEQTGAIRWLYMAISKSAFHSWNLTGWISGTILAILSNVTNNLPTGLLAGHILQNGHLPLVVNGYWAIAIDLGPNLSITGSLATILWLTSIRREGVKISGITFLKLGLVVMFTSLIAAYLGLMV